MAVYYKFKSAKDYDSVSIDGHFISVGNLKEKIVEKKNLGRGSDFDLLISNAQTNEEYTDDAQSIPKNTSVLVRRVPGKRQRPIVAEVRDEKTKEESSGDQASPVKHVIESSLVSKSKQLEESDWADEFGVDLYAMPEQLPPQQQLPQQQQQQFVFDKSEEDNKIKAFVDASASDWQRQTQETLSAGRGFGRVSQGRGLGGRGFGRGIGIEKKNPPQGYVCHRCGVPGHFIQHCPTNGDPAFDMKKMRPPTGIPKSMLVANPDGSYALPSGAVAILRPNEAVFEKEIEGMPSNRTIAEIPPELCCPLCSGVLKDAVLTSRCCFKSYCDKCIRDQILSNGKCVCGATNVLADDLLPNKTLRDAINRLLETTTATTSSAEHAGSLHQVQDMESAQRPKPKAPSPSGSASQKNGSVTLLPLPDGLNDKGVAIGKMLPSQQTQQSPNRNLAHKRLEPFEHTAESNSRQELGSQGEVLGSQSTLHVEEEVQQETFADAAKKKKLKSKRQKPLNGEKEVYRRSVAAFEPPVDGGMMPYPGNPALYGNYWGGPQYIVDSFGQPIGNPQFPYFGYGVPGPVSCEMHYGAGMILPEPVGHPAFMPPIPTFQRDGMDHNMGALNSGSSVMSREEFEARKAELRRKRDFEQRVLNREEAKDTGSGDPGSSKVKRVSNFTNSSTSSPADESNDHAEKSTYYTRSKTSAGNSLSPQGVKRTRHERKEGTPILDTRFEWTNVEVQKGLVEPGERSEKKSKVSVFSRISFPEKSKERPKRLISEQHLDSKDSEGDGNTSVGLRSRRILGHGAERHSAGMDSVDALRHVKSPQDSVKLGSGRKSSYKEDRLRPMSRIMNKSKIQDEADGTDDDIYERNFKHRALYSTSPSEVNTRSGKRRQS